MKPEKLWGNTRQNQNEKLAEQFAGLTRRLSSDLNGAIKMQIFILLLKNLLVFSPFVKAQTAQNQTTGGLPNPSEIYRKYVGQNNYITPIFELKNREDKYLASRRPPRLIRILLFYKL